MLEPVNDVTWTMIQRYQENMRRALACGCGGVVHPEHEVDDLVADTFASRIGSSYFTDANMEEASGA